MCCVRLGGQYGLEVGGGGSTLETGLDYVERMDGECGYCAGGEAGDGLDQRGRQARMVFIHIMRAMVWSCCGVEGKRL